MKECLVDVLNARDTVLHVFPVAVEDEAVAPQEALKAAADLGLGEECGLHARVHVSRGGQLAPFGDPLAAGHHPGGASEQDRRTQAYFLWQAAGCPDDRAEEHWHRACAAGGNGSSA